MGVKGWEINNRVKVVLTRNWVDILHLLINTAKDTVVIKGELKFKGGKVSVSSEMSVVECLKKIEREIFQTKGVKMVKWELTQWEKHGGRWHKKKIKHNFK